MSKHVTQLIGAVVTLAVMMGAPAAQAQFYLGAEGGWTGLQGTKDSVTGTNPRTGQTVTLPIDQSFNGGYNVGARAGYQWNAFRFEGEYSYRSSTGNATSLGTRLNANVNTNSFMFNGIYDFVLGWPVTPHIGVGLGGARVNGNVDGPAVGFHSKTSDVVFAYQAIAGARYMLTPAIALDLDYRYRGSTEQSFTTREFTVNGVTFPSRKYSGSGNTNNIVASVTYLFLPPPPVAVAAPPPPPIAPPKLFIVFFDWDQATVTPEGMQVVQQAAAAYRGGRSVRLQVTGYTDRSGSPGYNQRLSERRAAAVAKELGGMGVPQSDMIVSGRGENDNRVPTADGVREPQNRRVEISS